MVGAGGGESAPILNRSNDRIGLCPLHQQIWKDAQEQVVAMQSGDLNYVLGPWALVSSSPTHLRVHSHVQPRSQPRQQGLVGVRDIDLRHQSVMRVGLCLLSPND